MVSLKLLSILKLALLLRKPLCKKFRESLNVGSEVVVSESLVESSSAAATSWLDLVELVAGTQDCKKLVAKKIAEYKKSIFLINSPHILFENMREGLNFIEFLV